jgi:aromatic ring-opening dioxygenase catalytic subunit (LigB family)
MVRVEARLSGSGHSYRESLGHEALLSIPTPDHYLPLLYVIGARQKNDAISFPVEGVDGGSISMLTVRVGSTEPNVHPAR